MELTQEEINLQILTDKNITKILEVKNEFRMGKN